MKVLVIGANGQVGKHVIDKLIDNNHEAIAMIRNTDQIPYFEERGASTVIADLEKDFKHAFYGVDAVIFAAGSGPHTSADKTIMIDQEGAIKSMKIAENFGIKRFVMLSSMAANRPEIGPETLRHYLYAKGRADAYLRGTTLDYTIVRPGGLTNDKGTGNIKINEHLNEFGSIPREDVAQVLVQTLQSPQTVKQSYDLVSGSTKIDQAL
ncbi:SDR family oxidoreductase [Pontibacillus marinus]|uniref:NAD dependent epimerase/dehydratase n=1 Tax=Pontibacillus marinus BH030004 = DSM 16465 TaxID=1385511 RepID=A0A0A5G707_9BACI|nr:SDR family oxidoreductase [Pontibacillus marinus]KGX87844.1 NAD dependent epimerase/dehydratase [Pontibacillus marinus BH030004 = DSM 16465]